MPRTVSPHAAGFRMPAEWEPHEAVWLGWPCAAELWQEDLLQAQNEFIAFCEAIAALDPITQKPRGERLNILVPNQIAGAEAEQRLSHLPVRLHLIPFGEIWLRDIAPLFLKGPGNEIATLRFAFNGWGGKYELVYSKEVASQIAAVAGFREFSLDWISEGGSLEFDGEGTCLTTRQCLLNENRNPGMSQAEIEQLLRVQLGIQKTLWLGDGLINDHTDGHIDTLARFVGPGHVVIHQPLDTDDPNREVMLKVDQDLQKMSDAKGRKIKITRVPSPGRVVDEYEGELMPASYLNFFIANTKVIVPTFGTPHDSAAVATIASCFTDRQTVGLSAKAILAGGGAFHCMSQQQPRPLT